MLPAFEKGCRPISFSLLVLSETYWHHSQILFSSLSCSSADPCEVDKRPAEILIWIYTHSIAQLLLWGLIHFSYVFLKEGDGLLWYERCWVRELHRRGYPVGEPERSHSLGSCYTRRYGDSVILSGQWSREKPEIQSLIGNSTGIPTVCLISATTPTLGEVVNFLIRS